MNEWMNNFPKLIIHGLGDLGIDIIQTLNTMIEPLRNHLIDPNQKGDPASTKLVFATSILDHSSRRLRQTAKTYTIQGKLSEGTSISPQLNKKLIYYYGYPRGSKRKLWLPTDAPRLDFFVADITDPNIKQWIPKILSIAKPPNSLRILLIASTKPTQKAKIELQNDQRFDCVLQIPIPANTRGYTKLNLQETILSETVQILFHLLITLIYTGEINIDFQDIYSLLKQGSDGLILSRPITTYNFPKQIRDPFTDYFLPFPPETVSYSIISLIDFNGSLRAINYNVKRYQQFFAKDIDLKWSVTTRPYLRKQGESSYLLIIGII